MPGCSCSTAGPRSSWKSAGSYSAQVVLAAFSIAALGVLISAIPYGLLGQPDMGLINGYGGLPWFMDRTAAQLPQPFVLSVSIWFYKLAMLLWALWLSFALLRWLPWAWRQYAGECGASMCAPSLSEGALCGRAAAICCAYVVAVLSCGLVSGALADEQVTSLPSETPATFTPTNADFDYVARNGSDARRREAQTFILIPKGARTRRCCYAHAVRRRQSGAAFQQPAPDRGRATDERYGRAGRLHHRVPGRAR